MVTTIIISLAAVAVAAILCFKGLKINFNKTFTINDNRKLFTAEQTQDLENRINADKLNPIKDTDKDDTKNIMAPMDTVLKNIADVFGPGNDDKSEDKK